MAQTKLPSGILVRDTSNNKIYFIDNGTKRLITSPDVLTPGSGFVDIDPSHLADVPDGASISSQPNFDFKSREQAQALIDQTGINFVEPRGFDPSKPTPEPTPTPTPTPEPEATTQTSGGQAGDEPGGNVYRTTSGSTIAIDGVPDGIEITPEMADSYNSHKKFQVYLSDGQNKGWGWWPDDKDMIVEAMSLGLESVDGNALSSEERAQFAGERHFKIHILPNLRTGGAGAEGTTPYYGTLQDLADQGLQVSNGKVYDNGVVVGTYGGESPEGGTGETPDPGTGTGEINTQAAHAVNQMYQKYFGRDATTGEGGELEFWTTQSITELETQLAATYENSTGHAYDGSPLREGATGTDVDLGHDQQLLDGMAVLDTALANGTIPQDVYEIWKLALENYPPGVEFDAANIIESFEKIQEKTIDPYFNELIAIAKSDIQTAFGAMEGARGRELEAEGIAASERIKGEKGSLEAKGLTFTGEAGERLGGESAFTEGGNVPFGGDIGEGLLPTQNRLIASSTDARYKDSVRGLVAGAENLLGTAGTAGLGLPGIDRPGVVETGEIENKRSGIEGGALQNLINQQNQVAGLNTVTNQFS